MTADVRDLELSAGSPRAHFWCKTLGELALFTDRSDPAPLVRSAKPLAVLAYVGLSPRGRADRDHVARLIWPDVDITDARHSLRQSLYRLRSTAGDTGLVDARGTELLLQSSVEFDWREAERATPDRLEEAYALLSGGFLDGFAIPESKEFEAWAESQRARFRDLRTRVGMALAGKRLEAGQAEAALEIADDLCALHPFDPAPLRLAMSALTAVGRQATAVARYHGFATLLARELDEEPPNELSAYAGEIARLVQGRPARVANALPLVGRAREWTILEEAWGAAHESRGNIVLVEGAAGIGKTRLVGELEARCAAAKGVVLNAKCYEIERSVPYGVVAEALAHAVDNRELAALDPAWLAEAARVLPELRERFPNLSRFEEHDGSAATKRRLHHALWRCLEVIAADRPVLVVVDDLHWADAASLEALHFAAIRLRPTRTLFAATYRPAELTPNARQFVRSVCAARSARLVALEPLSAGHVRELLEKLGAFDSPDLGRAVAAHLHSSSAGNPLFLAELLDALARSRVLALHERRWSLAAGAQIEELPKTLGKLMSDRIEALAPWMRACVEVLSVAADAIIVDVLARALELSEPRAELALAALEEDHLVRRSGPATFELIHDELRHLVYLGIPDQRRRLLHAAVGLALEELAEAKRPGGAARLAFHFDQADERERAHRYATAAAREASAFAASDVAQTHREMADAHAPKALPPGSIASTPRRRLTRYARAAARLAAVGAVLAAGVLLGARMFGRSSSRLADQGDYRQGLLSIATRQDGAATHVVGWPAQPDASGHLEESHATVAGGTRVIAKWITVGDGTHSKLFRVRGADTVQITFGESDDRLDAQSPDAQLLLVERGWKASATHYQNNIFVLNAHGRVLGQLTNTPYQDQRATWAPNGAHIAFFRDSLGTVSLWISDADGGYGVNLTERLDLPRTLGTARFAPDASRLAVLYRGASASNAILHVIQLQPLMSRAIKVPAASAPAGSGRLLQFAWSPDGRWIAYSSFENEEWLLRTIALERPDNPQVVLRQPGEIYPVDWNDGGAPYIDRVSLTPESVALRAGSGRRIAATVINSQRAPISATIRWQVIDTAVARVDERGFVVGRSPGTTRLVAGAGGFRADTVDVNVSYAAVDTLYLETWAAGLDTTAWRPYGTPSPRTVRQSPLGRGAAFVSSGDYNHFSGAVSSAAFSSADDGLTVEVDGWLGFTGTHWQDWSLDLLADTLRKMSEEGPSQGQLHIGLYGSNPTASQTIYSACEARGELDGERLAWLTRQWHSFSIQLRPDGVAECYMGGVLLGSQELRPALRNRRYSIMLAGRMENTAIYHGRVLVTRGLRR